MDVFDVYAKLSLKSEDYDKGLDNAKNKATEFGNTLAQGLGGAVAAVGTATIAAITAVGAAVGSIVTKAVESYANYEQLVGGVETLFKDSAGIVEDYAVQAYKTAGISANQYMETVTGFSASLLQSLGGDTAKAAEIGNMAIIDMSDNANKMGTSMQSIQYAYQGFAKQNYTMLDNLKLGYGGTRQEMERLLEDAEKISGIKYDISNLSDVYNAIHVIQTELGITGTTAKEAATTISGSWNMVKAAWTDLLTSIAGGGKGMSTAISDLVQSVESLANNAIPVIQESLYGIGDLVSGIAPIIAETLPNLINILIPMFLDTVMVIVDSLVQSLPTIAITIVSAITNILPDLISALLSILDTLLSSILPAIFDLAIQLVIALGKGLTDNIGTILSSLITLINYIVQVFLDNLPMIIQVGLNLILAIAEGLLSNMNYITDTIMSIVSTLIQIIVENLPMFLELGVQILANIALGIVMAIPMLLVSIGRVLGIVDEAKRDVGKGTNEINAMVDESGNYISDSMSQMNSMMDSARSSLENTTNNMNDMTTETRESAKDISADIIISAKEAQKNVKDFIVSGVMVTFNQGLNAANDFIRQFERIINQAINLLIQLDNTVAVPTIDASSVEAGSRAIINAVQNAISALSSLNGMSASASVNFGGGHASGGWMTAGTSYLVGELGPELVTPTRSGYVHTAQETASILGGGNNTRDIVININGDIYDDEYSMRRKMKSAMLDILQEQMSYG